MQSSAHSLQADNISSVITRAGVEIGLANLNLNTSTILQDFAQIRNLGDLVDLPRNYNVSSIPDHAESRYPNFQAQVRKCGLPPFYSTLLEGVQVPPKALYLSKDAIYDQGMVIFLERSENSTGSIKVSLNASHTVSAGLTQPGTKCTIQLDVVARRSNCFLPKLIDTSSLVDAKRCGSPRQLMLRSQVLVETSAGQYAITAPSEIGLKSSFNFEFGPALGGPPITSLDRIGVSTLPVAWETIVMERLNGHHKLLLVNIESTHDDEMELVLEVE